MAEEETANVISGEVSGQAVQVGAVHGDMYVGVSREVPRAVVDPPAGWEELPELPAKIVSLLRAQIENAEIMPYRLRGARRPSLSTVYVRQDVTSKTEVEPADQRRPLPVLDSKGRLIDVPYPPVARLTVRPPSRRMQDALDGGDHMLVTGGPGQGKSTLSLQLAADVARRWQGGDGPPPLSEPVLPLRVTARELAARLDLSFFEALVETVRGEYGAMLAQPLGADDLTGRVAGCRWLLLVDGVDEVADPVLRDRLVTVLATRASDVTDAYRVVLTTRPIEGATLAPLQRIGAARYELLPFDEAAFGLFAENWFSSSGQAKKFVRQIRDAHLDELVRVPLLATIAAIIFEQYADRPLPDNQYELYETYLDYLRSAHPAPPGAFDDCRGRLMEHLGRVRLEEDASLVTAACRWISEHLPALGPEVGWRDELIVHLTGVGPFVRRGDDLGFLHHSFAEHLAATAKARLLPAAFEASQRDFIELLHAAEPEERGRYARRVLLHYTRLYSAEADRLVCHLHDGGPQQHLLAARLLAWHVPASREVVDAFLTIARAWAATTQYPAEEILSSATRAAHHPGLVSWLRDLMRDSGIPWPSRVEAAVALATRLNTENRPAATTTLRTVVHDAAIEVQARLDAAEALAQCGDGERAAAEAGLRSVLDSPAATVEQCGDAAVVLAGLGPEARARAVAALTAVLDDGRAPESDLVAAATSLVEVDIEFHERCASVFRAVLQRRSWSSFGVEEAARGLASLGAEHLADAAVELERRITDCRLHFTDRCEAAQFLLRLGPQYRGATVALVRELMTSRAASFFDRASLAWRLAECGPDLHELTLEIIRSVLLDPAATAPALQVAGRTLAALGPDHWPDAAQALARAVGHPRGSVSTGMTALGQLAKLGAPHKEPAVERLRSAIKDPASPVETRFRAASELFGLGPGFHVEAVGELIRITALWNYPKFQVEAWRQLRQLNPEMEKRASAKILELIRNKSVANWPESLYIYRGDVLDPADSARLLESMADDEEVSGSQRRDAAASLSLMHYRYQAAAARGFIRLIRDGLANGFEVAVAGRLMSYVGADSRRVIADEFRELVASADSRPDLVCGAAEALDAFDGLSDGKVSTLLRKVAADHSADAASRCKAVVLLAKNEVIAPGEAGALIVRLFPKLDSFEWSRYVEDAVSVGAEPVDEIRSMMVDRDVPHRFRQQAAMLLAKLGRVFTSVAKAELAALAEDPFLDTYYRTSAWTRLATAAPSSAVRSAEALRAMVDDERVPVARRCDAGYELAAIEQSGGEQASRIFLRFAAAPEYTPKERDEALRKLTFFHVEDVASGRLRLALANDPAAAGQIRAGLLRNLPDEERRTVGRAMVLDRLVSPADWANGINHWIDRRLASAAERELDDRLAGPEPTAGERIDAAMALSRLSPGHEPKAVKVLEEIGRGAVAVRRVRHELASLAPRWRERVLAEAGAVLADVDRSRQDRVSAGFTVAKLTSELPDEVRAQLRRLAADERTARRLRARILHELRCLAELRSIRDDRREQINIRRYAANRLAHYSREDRAAAASLLHVVATDPACHPRLRWWAADNLAESGTRGHELGTVALEALMVDEALPVSVRQDAARALGVYRPDLRSDVINQLRRFTALGKPLVRVMTWKSLGLFEPSEGALGLLGMARDRSLEPVVRCRSAWAAARLHRDHRETAAVVAREIAHDDDAPAHVRISAARLLAAVSELCRPEARELIERLKRQAAGPKRRR